MATTATDKEFVQRVYDALTSQDRAAFVASCTDGFPLHSGEKGFRGVDAGDQNDAAAGHYGVDGQRRSRHVSR
jgi:hypothetical protein